jgi:hypothetical protein
MTGGWHDGSARMIPEETPAHPQSPDAVKRMRDKDVLFSLVLIAGSVAVISYALSISFEAMRVMQAEFYTAPGFFVLVVGAGLLLLSVSLLVTALRQGGSLRWVNPANLLAMAKRKSSRQTAAVFAYLFLYMCLFWERTPVLGLRVPFWLGTFVFLALLTLTFNRKHWPAILLGCAAATAIIDLSFRLLVRVPLP